MKGWGRIEHTLNTFHLPTVLNLAVSLKFDGPLKLTERILASYVVRGISPVWLYDSDVMPGIIRIVSF